MPKTNHRLKSVFLFLKKSRISAFFYSPFLPKKIGQFISTIIFTTTIATPAMAFKDYKCGCGSHSDLYNRPTCYAPPDYLTEYCVVKKTSSSFTYRMPFSAGMDACRLCSCNSYTNDWACVVAGTLYMPLTIPIMLFFGKVLYSFTDEYGQAMTIFLGTDNVWTILGITCAVLAICFVGSVLGMIISRELKKAGVLKK